jgi:hypothetical protein
VVGKSLASAAAGLVAARDLPAVWLTPLLDRTDVAEAIGSVSAPTLLVGSPADPAWGPGPPAAAALQVLTLDGLDHSLQVADDPLASLDVLRTVTESVSAFLDRLG